MPTRTTIIRADGEGDAIWFNNDLFTFKATSDETGNAFTLFEECTQRGKVTPLHLHPKRTKPFASSMGRFASMSTARNGPWDREELPPSRAGCRTP